MSTDDTAASEHGAEAETTQVPAPPGDEPGLAWSADDETDEVPANRHGRLIWVGLSVLVVAIAAALVLLVSTLLGRHTTDNTRPQPVPSPPVITTAAAAPTPQSVAPPPTMTAPPPVTITPPTPSPIYSDKDRKFIGLLRGNESLGDPGTNTPAVLATAQYVCDEMQSGGNPTELHSRLHAVWPSIAENDVTWFMYVSVNTYCPQVAAGAYRCVMHSCRFWLSADTGDTNDYLY
ncbi:DUF732 domain-containing protein [Mycobacterium simulans]|uniref:DUF732 domain-containing protein n=1 Tax=Mycobacterium simulans TaxID=627089 RepID=UPI00163EEE5D|nr:DUF732 domain-containing protein [Mycobacterium simulans]